MTNGFSIAITALAVKASALRGYELTADWRGAVAKHSASALDYLMVIGVCFLGALVLSLLTLSAIGVVMVPHQALASGLGWTFPIDLIVWSHGSA